METRILVYCCLNIIKEVYFKFPNKGVKMRPNPVSKYFVDSKLLAVVFKMATRIYITNLK